MVQYQVVVNPIKTEPGNLQFLSRLEPEAWSTEYVDTDADGNEVYKVEVADDYVNWVEQQLDTTSGVVSYRTI